MKNFSKRSLAAFATISLLSTGSVFAVQENKNVTEPAPITDEVAAPIINGATLSAIKVEEVNGIKMFPLREAAEGFGYTVAWEDANQAITLTKGAQFITMAIGQDAYAFSRQAHQSLGAAPYLFNGTTTYVPLAFLTDIMGGYYSVNEDGSYKMVLPSQVTVTAVDENSITVNDIAHGEVVIKIDEATVVENGTIADIKAESVIGVEYGPAMTLSIPPQATAVKIILENLPSETEVEETEALTFKGVITEIEDEKITLGDPTKDADAISLIVTDETVITKGLDKRIYKLDDLEIGMEISGTKGEMTTLSIPPQSVALTIEIAQ